MSKLRFIRGGGFGVFPAEPPELVLPEETLDIEMTECGRLLLRQESIMGPAIEFLNLGTAIAKTQNSYTQRRNPPGWKGSNNLYIVITM